MTCELGIALSVSKSSPRCGKREQRCIHVIKIVFLPKRWGNESTSNDRGGGGSGFMVARPLQYNES
jgi:hypothetical protein